MYITILLWGEWEDRDFDVVYVGNCKLTAIEQAILQSEKDRENYKVYWWVQTWKDGQYVETLTSHEYEKEPA